MFKISLNFLLICLWASAVVVVVLPVRFGEVNLFVNKSLSLYRNGDDAEVVEVFVQIWTGLVFSVCLLSAATALLVGNMIFKKTIFMKSLIVNFAVWGFVFATMWPLFLTSADTGQPTRVLKNNPLSHWAFCNRNFAINTGKIGFGFYFNSPLSIA